MSALSVPATASAVLAAKAEAKRLKKEAAEKITAWKAKKLYPLDDDDLAKLKSKKRKWDRLYWLTDVQKAGEAKQTYMQTNEYKTKKKAEDAAKKAAKNKVRADKCQQDAAALQVPVFECEARPNQKQMLPLVLWVEILSHLADDLEPDRGGMRSVSVVAREMVRFCWLSKELYEALPGALSRLGALSAAFVAPPPNYSLSYYDKPMELPRDIDWQLLLQDPTKCSRKVLDKAASAIFVPKSGRLKATLAKNICAEFGVQQRSNVNAFVLWSVAYEKRDMGDYELYRKIRQCDPDQKTVTWANAFSFRKAFLETYGDLATFKAKYDAWQQQQPPPPPVGTVASISNLGF